MLRKTVLSLVSVIVVLTSACGGGRNPDLAIREETERSSEKLSGQSFQILAGAGSLALEDEVLLGTGTILFLDPLADIQSANHFSLEFRLSAFAELSLISNTDRSLDQGVEFHFHRPSSASNLKVTLKAQGNEIDISEAFSKTNASGTIKIALDVHNNEGEYAHIVMWDESAGSVDEFPTYDSGSVRNGTPGRGFGALWGLQLKNAVVLKVAKGEPRDEH